MSAWTRRAVVLPLVSWSLLLTFFAGCGPAAGEPTPGTSESEAQGGTGTSEDELGLAKRAAVFTLTNEAENAVLAFKRGTDGRLTQAGRTPTGGAGSGGGLGSQGALTLSPNGRWLLAVNAGSNEISVFAVAGTKLYLASKTSSGGQMPISVTVRGGLVYVLNAGGAGNVTGFHLDWSGCLYAIPGGSRPLSTSASGPAQVSLTSDLRTLVVTEKATNRVTTYSICEDGTLSAPVVTASNGQTPFGFAMTSDDTLIVSEAFGAAAGLGAVSSYRVGRSNGPALVSASLRNGQTAPCWVVVTSDDGYAYASNTPGGTITGLAIDTAGGLTLLGDGGRTAITGEGSRPADMALSHGSQYLYVLEAGSHKVSAFRVRANGSLVAVPLTGTGNLPASTVGLVAI